MSALTACLILFAGIEVDIAGPFTTEPLFDGWNRLVARVRTDQEGFKGELILTVRSWGREPARFRRPLTLPPHADRSYPWDLQLDGWEEEAVVELIDTDGERVAWKSSHLSFVRLREINVIAIGPAPRSLGKGRRSISLALKTLPLPAFPTDPVPLLQANTIIFRGPHDLDPGQQEALRTWLEAGGQLVLFAGQSVNPLRRGIWREICPIDPTEITAATFQGIDQEVSIPIMEGSIREGDGFLELGGTSLGIRSRYGLGEVVFLRFPVDLKNIDLLVPPETMWRSILTSPSEDEMERFRRRGDPVFKDAARLLQFILPAERKLDMRYAGLGLLLLIGYVVAIGPVDYIRLRRKSRLKRGWASFSVYTLACSAVFLLWGSLFSPASTTLQQVVFADEGIVQTFSMLQGGKSAQFKIDGEGAISALDSMWFGWGESPSEGWTVEPPSRLTLPVAVLSRRLISSCRTTKDGEIGIAARWETPAEGAVLLENRGLLHLEQCFLLKDDRVYSIGSLPRDSKKSVKLGETPSRTLRDWINGFTKDEPGFSPRWIGYRQVSLGPAGWLFALSFYDKWRQQAGYGRIPYVIRQRKLDMSATIDRGATILVGLFRQDLSGVKVDGYVKQETLGIVRIPVETMR